MKTLKRLLIALFRGSDSGQSIIEYLIIVSACALLEIAGFSRYGTCEGGSDSESQGQ